MIRRIARPMLATVFVVDGVETLRNPQPHVETASPLVDKAAPLVEKGEKAVNDRVTTAVPTVTKDPETLVKVLAGVKIGAGLTFALGKAPRISALALTATHVPTTVSRNAFWNETDPAAKSRKTTGLATDVALLGALLLASADTAGQPGLAWRARDARSKAAAKLPGSDSDSPGGISGAAHSVADQARGAADTVRGRAPEIADSVRERAPEVADQVKSRATDLADRVRANAPVVADRLKQGVEAAREQAAPVAAQVRDQAAPVAAQVRDQAAPVASQVREQAAPAAARVREQAAPVAAQVREQAGPAAARVREQAGVAAQRANARTRSARAGGDVRRQADAWRQRVADTIRP